MSIILAGVSHHNTPLSIRERLYFPEGDMDEWLDRLADYRGLDERLILSTCNRVEVYSAVEDFEQGLDAIHRFFLESRDIGAEELNAHLYVHREDEATRHLFTVASSLDSMVVGEPQILGQVKEAYRVAQASGHAGKSLTNLFSRAFRVAKKIREQTPIGESPVSVSSVAVDLAKRIFGSLSGKNVLLLGAGEMGEAAARHLKAGGADTLRVANRTFARAQELAAKLGGLALSFDNLEEALIDADVVITSTASQGFILDKPTVAAALERRRDAPVFLIDIAVPRNVAPEVNDLEDAYLYDVDDLQSVAADNLRGREEVARVAGDSGKRGADLSRPPESGGAQAYLRGHTLLRGIDAPGGSRKNFSKTSRTGRGEPRRARGHDEGAGQQAPPPPLHGIAPDGGRRRGGHLGRIRPETLRRGARER